MDARGRNEVEASGSPPVGTGAPGPGRRQRGVSLVELLVSSAIGIFLTGGALLVYVESRDTILVSESIARVQESARYALAVIEPDVRGANFWGVHDVATAIELRATDATPLDVAVANDCAEDFSIDVETPLDGVNAAVPADWTCLAADEHQPLSDLLIVRRAAEPAVDSAALEAGHLYVRTDEAPRGRLFVGAAEPAGFSPFAENHELVTHVYYVRPWSFTDAGGARDALPSLRYRRLTTRAGGPELVDEEVIPGVEDLQVQLGVDTDGDDAANLYVDPDNDTVLDAAGARIVAVRLWLMMRTEVAETGYRDNASYSYADVTRVSGAVQFPNDVRRVLISRTIALRNP